MLCIHFSQQKTRLNTQPDGLNGRLGRCVRQRVTMEHRPDGGNVTVTNPRTTSVLKVKDVVWIHVLVRLNYVFRLTTMIIQKVFLTSHIHPQLGLPFHWVAKSLIFATGGCRNIVEYKVSDPFNVAIISFCTSVLSYVSRLSRGCICGRNKLACILESIILFKHSLADHSKPGIFLHF